MERKNAANIFVRECITQALLKLMKQGKYYDITVSELVKTAGVSRNSFYRNYESIDDILKQHLEERTAKWWDNYIKNPNGDIIAEVFRHFLDMKEVITLLYSQNLSHLLSEHIVMCGKLSLTGSIENAYKTAYMSGGLFGIADEWIKNGMKESPEQMQAIFFGESNDKN